MPMSAREAALRSLSAYRRAGAWPDKSLGGLFVKSELSKRDTALAAHIVNGVLQNLLLLDYYIDKLSAIGMKKIEPQILDILRLSVYQILFMRVPVNAVVNEGVKLAKKHANPRAAGFVNALLRRMAEAAENSTLPEIFSTTEAGRLAIRYSHPEWFVRELYEMLGPDETEKLLIADNSIMPITAQVNTLITNTDGLLAALESEDIQAARHEWLDNCLILSKPGNIERLDAFKRGLFYIQDAAARLAVEAAGIKPGDTVLDGCAAPGGKSFAAALAMENRGEVIALDIHEAKLRHINDGARRLSISTIKTHAFDAAESSAEFYETADTVIADVPCSGFGVICKKPEIRYKKPEDIGGLPDIQKRILKNLSECVKPGGGLIYSTCTVLKRENEDVIKWFLNETGDFEPESFTLPGIGRADSGMVTLWPHLHGTDGFFICKLRKKT